MDWLHDGEDDWQEEEWGEEQVAKIWEYMVWDGDDLVPELWLTRTTA